MSAKLFNEPQQSERPGHKRTIKKIDDLILDAEIEAQAEINQKIRSNNTRTLLLVLVGVGLLYVFYNGVQNQTIPIPSFLTEETQVAQAPTGPKPTPIPFPVTESAPATEAATSSSDEPEGENLSPLENEVISMIQKNLGEPGATIPELAPEQSQNTPGVKSTSPSATEVSPPTSVKPTQPALNPVSRSRRSIRACLRLPRVVKIVNSTWRPSGKKRGDQCPVSPLSRLSVVTCLGSPPSSEISKSGDAHVAG